MSLYLVESSRGPHRDMSKGVREQDYWDDHATFIDALTDEGFIALGGPLPDEGGAVLVVRAGSPDFSVTTRGGSTEASNGRFVRPSSTATRLNV